MTGTFIMKLMVVINIKKFNIVDVGFLQKKISLDYNQKTQFTEFVYLRMNVSKIA